MIIPQKSYSPVWFSTDKQLETLISAYTDASLFDKLFMRYAVPNDAASLQNVLMPWMRVTVLRFSAVFGGADG